MLPLDTLLARPGLPPHERALIAAKIAIAGPDWDRLGQCLAAARAHELERSAAAEMLLQAVLYFGFPRAITAFESLVRVWPDEAGTPRPGGALPDDEQAAAGLVIFETIYGRNAEPVRAMLRSFHPELHDFVLGEAYGRILSRPGLPSRLRELLAVGALAAMEQLQQLVAHGRGALAFGATEEELREAMVTAGSGPERIDEQLRRILK